MINAPEAPAPPPHEIVLSVGRTGSGKTRILSRVYGPRHARRITIDAVGEGATLYPDAVEGFGLQDCLRLLAAWGEDDVERWHLVAVLSPAETAELMRALVPVYAPDAASLARDLGGVCVECFEIDTYLPVSGAGAGVVAAWTTAFARGRHVGCSILAATQRPHQCARIVSSQASRLIAFSTHEPRDLKFLRDVGGTRFAAIAQSGLKPFESVHYDARAGSVEVFDRSYIRRWRGPAFSRKDGGMLDAFEGNSPPA